MEDEAVTPPERPRARGSEAHIDLLRAFRGEDGSVLIHRNGARSDAQLLEKAFLLQVLTKDSHELLNRPSKGLSMLAVAMVHGAVALERLEVNLVQKDRTAGFGCVSDLQI